MTFSAKESAKESADATLAVRLDSDGDVLLTGPALRALGTRGPVDLLVSPAGRAAAGLLPGLREVLEFDAPWAGFDPPPTDLAAVAELVADLEWRRYARCVVFTSFHQSPLPMALLARMAGIPYVAANSEDYPGSLLDLRHRRRDIHEVAAALELAAATGARLPAGDDGRLRLRPDLLGLAPGRPRPLPGRRYVVVHPGASVPARALTPEHARRIVDALNDAGRQVIVTGSPSERELGRRVAGSGALDLTGHTSLAGLAVVLAGADCLICGNTGPAHLAAATGVPVVSLFAPVVPAARWAPYGVPTVVLGDQDAPCRDTRARVCPVAGHPCLSSVHPGDVVGAVEKLAGEA